MENFAAVFLNILMKYFNTNLNPPRFLICKVNNGNGNGKYFADLTQERGEESSGPSCSKHAVQASFLFDVLQLLP